MEEQKRLIVIAERAKGVEGSEKWGIQLFSHDTTERLELLPSGTAKRVDPYENTPPITHEFFDGKEWKYGAVKGPLLPHNPLDPMNPRECLKRAKAFVSQWHDGYRMAVVSQKLCVYTTEQYDTRVIFETWPVMPDYDDYVEALLNLYDLAKSEGGEWAKAWDRAMTPEGE